MTCQCTAFTYVGRTTCGRCDGIIPHGVFSIEPFADQGPSPWKAPVSVVIEHAQLGLLLTQVEDSIGMLEKTKPASTISGASISTREEEMLRDSLYLGLKTVRTLVQLTLSLLTRNKV